MFDKPLSALFSKLKKWLKNSSLMKIKPINALVFFLKSWWHIVTVTAITVICLCPTQNNPQQSPQRHILSTGK